MEGVDHDELRLADPMLDLAAYREAVERVPADRYCFVNSWAELSAPNWLGLMEGALGAHGAGLVGASGSWGSIRSYQRFMLGLGGPYGRVFSDRRRTVAALEAIAQGDPAPAEARSGRAGLPVVGFARALAGQVRGFSPFPAPHIRTSSFMIASEVLSRLRLPVPRSKNDTYRLESGRESITAQVERLGLSAVVVGRDGIAYRQQEWPHSRTFWQNRQENLLIADKQTAYYERGEEAERAILTRYAWGLTGVTGPGGHG